MSERRAGPLKGADCASCLVCGGKAKVAGSRNGYAYWRCGACGLYFVHPRPAAEELSRWYGPEYYTGKLRDSFGHIVGYEDYDSQGPRDAQYLFSWLRHVLDDWHGLHVLDVGCARGYLAGLLTSAGATVEGVESSATALSQAVDRGLLIHPSLNAASLEAGAFDLVVMAEYLEHTVDPREQIRLASRCLRAGGRLVVTVPNGSQRCVAKHGISYHSFTAPVHLQVFTRGSLERVVDGFFKVVRCDPYVLNVENPMPRAVLTALRIGPARIRFDGFSERYEGLGRFRRNVLRAVRIYRHYLRHRALDLNMGLRLVAVRT